MNKLIKILCLSTVLVVLLACSKPDISGVWIPEKISSSDTFYSYYEIRSLDSNRYGCRNSGRDRYFRHYAFDLVNRIFMGYFLSVCS